MIRVAWGWIAALAIVIVGYEIGVEDAFRLPGVSYLNPTVSHVSPTASSFTCGTLLLLFRHRQPHSYTRDMPHSSWALSAARRRVGYEYQRGV